ncbi:MAG: transposase, partial [Desulfobulbaceae bacterium]|nr:transposase [Desulfobulbaceae bacterium]
MSKLVEEQANGTLRINSAGGRKRDRFNSQSPDISYQPVMRWSTKSGHFYASLESGHVNASTAMKRLNGYTGKNNFYRGNRELGQFFKTEHILQYLSDKTLRQRIRRGLLKGEQIHALARDLNYSKRRRISSSDLQ